MAQKSRKMALEAWPEHKGLREGDRMLLDAEPGTKQPRKKSLRLWEQFHLFNHSFASKSYFAESQF